MFKTTLYGWCNRRSNKFSIIVYGHVRKRAAYHPPPQWDLMYVFDRNGGIKQWSDMKGRLDSARSAVTIDNSPMTMRIVFWVVFEKDRILDGQLSSAIWDRDLRFCLFFRRAQSQISLCNFRELSEKCIAIRDANETRHRIFADARRDLWFDF